MPRRSGRSGMSAPRMPARPARPTQSNVPAQRQPNSVSQPAPQQSSQPGLFANMASTAAGVAVGSTVGHVVGGALTGAFSGSDSNAPQQYQDGQYANYQQTQPSQNPCEYQLKQFLECAQNQHDISLCEGFNDALKYCKITNGLA